LVQIKTGLGIDSHRFSKEVTEGRPFMLGGVQWDEPLSLSGNSDADVVLHALTDAISSITGNTIIGQKADELCRQGIIDSSEYLKLALADLNSFQITHVAIALECLRPKIDPKVQKMRASIAQLLNIGVDCIGITATSGEELTDFGRGEGIFCKVIVTVVKDSND
jgi:2-C-methyl-D-erythritol 2,4-cyclodiphosphate synthase